MAQESIVKLEAFIAEGSAIGDIGAMTTRLSGSIYGIDLSLNETPRSVSIITSEMIDQFSVSSLNDLIKLTPGTFTSSFFGIEGSLEIRGRRVKPIFADSSGSTIPATFPLRSARPNGSRSSVAQPRPFTVREKSEAI